MKREKHEKKKSSESLLKKTIENSMEMIISDMMLNVSRIK